MKKREPVEFRRGDVLWIQCDPSVGVAPPRSTLAEARVANDSMAMTCDRAIAIHLALEPI